MRFRVGHGVDVHPFDDAKPLILGGCKLSETGGLEGHSDADAVLHAITDAILGAIAAGDIGEHFPSSDPRWSGASSATFVAEALRLMHDAGATLVNVDVTVLAQRPKLAPHRNVMRRSIAAMVGLPENDVSLKATTTDHLGFVGRGEGIAAMAVVLVETSS